MYIQLIKMFPLSTTCISPKMDVFSFGVLLVEMAIRVVPRPRGLLGKGGGREVRLAVIRGGQEEAGVRLMCDCEAHELSHVSQ